MNTDAPAIMDRSIGDHDVRRLRRSLVAFGLLGFLAPLVLASQTGALFTDIFALTIAATGATLNRRSFVTFPWTILLCLLYPLFFVAGCFSPDVSDYRYWFVPSRNFDVPGPHGLYLVLAMWACVNIVLICRFHRIQKLTRGKGKPWQYSLRSLLGMMVLVAFILGLGAWYYQAFQPPPWASTEALQRRYEGQLTALADYAYQHGPNGNYSEQEKIQHLFSGKEIVSVGVWTSSPDGRRMGCTLIKHVDIPGSMTCYLDRNPRIGHPVANLWNGRFVEYRALLKDKKGVVRECSITFDLSEMSRD